MVGFYIVKKKIFRNLQILYNVYIYKIFNFKKKKDISFKGEKNIWFILNQQVLF